MTQWLKRFFRFIHYYYELDRTILFFSMFYYILKNALPFIGLYISKCMIDELFKHGRYQLLLNYILFYTVFNFCGAIIEGYLLSRFQYHKAVVINKHDIYKKEKIMQLEYELIESNDVQNLLTEISYLEKNGIYNFAAFSENIGKLLGNSIGLCISVSLSCGFFAATIPAGRASNNLINIIFIIIFFVFNSLSYVIVSKYNKSAGEFVSDNAKPIFRLNRIYRDKLFAYKSGKDIRLYLRPLAEHAGEIFQNSMHFMYYSFWNKIGTGSTLSTLINSIISFLIYSFVLLKVILGSISVGSVVLYVGAINTIFNNAVGIIKCLGIIVPSDSYRKKLLSFYSIQGRVNGKKQLEKRHEYVIDFRDVSFRYSNTEKYALRHLNLQLVEGKRYALVGENGSGKSTLIKLLLRLYNPTEGRILFDDTNIMEFDIENYWDYFSVVFQDFGIPGLQLCQTIAASCDYDKEKIKDSLIKAGLPDFGKSNRIDMYLYHVFSKDGMEISGGESQKLAFARAIYKKSNIMILDEPTAALDPVSEYELFTKLSLNTYQKTAIFISHRLASCKFCDEVIVLDSGSVVQRGTHEELLQDITGKYYSMWNTQAQLYTENNRGKG